MRQVKITTGLRGFRVDSDSNEITAALIGMSESLIKPKIERQRGKVVVKPGDKYYVHNEKSNRFYFINDQLEHVKQVIDTQLARGLVKSFEVVYDEFKASSGTDVDFSKHTLNIEEPEDSDYFYQNDIVSHISRDGFNHDILEIQTGRGKTAMAMKSIVNTGKRTLLITKPGYLDKWVGDLTGDKYSLSLKPGELIKIGGKSRRPNVKEMDALLDMGRSGELDKGQYSRTCKVILISSKTFDLWIKECLKYGNEEAFETFMAVTGCGKLVYDETHEWFRNNYWTYMLLNPPRCLDLSATLVPEDPFTKDRYSERLPVKFRYNKLEYVKYIEALGIFYHLMNDKILDRINRMRLYNHIEFEKMIMRTKRTQTIYFEMVRDLLNMFYKNSKWEKGQRALVFFASREMCTRFTEYIKTVYPDLDVKRHIQGDDYDAFIKADLGISTPGKSGTAVDIPGLVLSIVTVCMSKEDKNLQILGRTREVKKWDIKPKAVFLHCQQLDKHVTYLRRRIKTFRGKVDSFRTLNSKFILR